MSYECRSGGGGAASKSKKGIVEGEAAESEAAACELGALKLDADEIAAFEKWMMEPSRPTDLVIKAAKAHKVLRARQIR